MLQTVSQRAQDIRARRAQSKIGQIAGASLLALLATLINAAPQAPQSDTITVDAAVDDTDYTFTVNAIDVTINSGTGATVGSIATALAAKLNSDPLIRGQVSASAAAAVVTTTALQPGVEYTIAEADANLTLASVTSAAEADPIPFGRLLISQGYQSGDAASYQDGEANELGALPRASAFTAQVDTIATPYVATAEYFASVTIDGATYLAQVTADTDAPTTGAALAAALNGVLPANTVLAAGTASGLTLTAEVPGATFETGIGASNDGASIPAVTVSSNKGLATSLAMAAAGISLWAGDEENVTVAPDGGDVVYPPNAGVKVLRSNADIWVENSESPSKGDAVYVETAAGDDLGKLFASASATRVLLPGAIWQRSARASSGDNIAALRLNLVG